MCVFFLEGTSMFYFFKKFYPEFLSKAYRSFNIKMKCSKRSVKSFLQFFDCIFERKFHYLKPGQSTKPTPKPGLRPQKECLAFGGV